MQETFAVTGGADYLVKMIVADLLALARVLNEVFLQPETRLSTR